MCELGLKEQVLGPVRGGSHYLGSVKAQEQLVQVRSELTVWGIQSK
jgi:hypothetical protein